MPRDLTMKLAIEKFINRLTKRLGAPEDKRRRIGGLRRALKSCGLTKFCTGK